ncbi:M20/M25/M40 family metallo-hydrolase [Flavobacterium silvaticum]|uniref:Vacuolar membrane protease n=1 Tax=Flavobacterium silvaticum TaxID=1852020 RepID=A0A972FRZ8_9FLAO|nr:M20/M25/M40 family metallo-hydrolase [Flavobacterium silvaticum]NMH28279.1 M20/M25/M40 family metallo-hydrolase [Flavobacterium silvaticum]
MNKKFASTVSAFFLILVLCWSYFSQLPGESSGPVPLSEFSTARTLDHVTKISQSAHFVGSKEHGQVASYLEKELRQIGLEVQSQEGFTLTEWGNLVKSKNIMARIKGSGSGKALLLLSHYDSAPHSYSKGASDDASGVAVILESIRCYLHNKTAHKNDIIILFTDAEELGLNGAALFVEKSNWAKDIGVVLNFEARGTSGPGYMLMEVNSGNSQMVDAFADADVSKPISNSLMYSIYKMLPNDTDLTVFREKGKIQGFNFAFIDSHFNYHTAQDDIDHLSKQTLKHQGDYLVPLLSHFANADLNRLNSDNDQIYFNTPFAFIHYPFSWNFVLLGIAAFVFAFFVFIGLGKRVLHLKGIGKGFVLFLTTVATTGVVVFLSWKGLLLLYPEYSEILQGFTYNGHYYIAAFLVLALGICLLFYSRNQPESQSGDYVVAPLVIWLLINLGIALYLPGAGFLIIPVFAAIFMFGYYMLTQRFSIVLFSILSVPIVLIVFPFLVMFPIGLGLKLLAGSAVLLTLGFGLLLPLFGQFKFKPVSAILLLCVSVGLLITAHFKSGFSQGEAKPNSLVFLYDAEKDQSYWATYDNTLDEWSKTYLGSDPKQASQINTLPLFSKYNTKFTYETEAMNRELSEPEVTFERDTVIGKYRHLTIRITPKRPVNRYDIFASVKANIYNLKANGVANSSQTGSLYKRDDRKLLSYYVVDNEPLVLQFSTLKTAVLDMELLEASFDLMKHPAFSMRKRANWMMPKPFVLTDAILIRKKITNTRTISDVRAVKRNFVIQTQANDTIPDADMENETITKPVGSPTPESTSIQ